MNADAIIGYILDVREGSKYTNRADDLGGPTKWGVTAKTLGAFLGRDTPATEAEVQALPRDQAFTILKKGYVTDPGFDLLDDGDLVALLVDSGVQFGPEEAVEWLQIALGGDAAGIKTDGNLGPKTLAAYSAFASKGALYMRVLGERIVKRGKVITRNPGQAANAKGWFIRDAEFLGRPR